MSLSGLGGSVLKRTGSRSSCHHGTQPEKDRLPVHLRGGWGWWRQERSVRRAGGRRGPLPAPLLGVEEDRVLLSPLSNEDVTDLRRGTKALKTAPRSSCGVDGTCGEDRSRSSSWLV